MDQIPFSVGASESRGAIPAQIPMRYCPASAASGANTQAGQLRPEPHRLALSFSRRQRKVLSSVYLRLTIKPTTDKCQALGERNLRHHQLDAGLNPEIVPVAVTIRRMTIPVIGRRAVHRWRWIAGMCALGIAFVTTVN
jgi:hypothetical protein